jgi:hypothetical protein
MSIYIPDGYDLTGANEDMLRIARDSQLDDIATIEAWDDDDAFIEEPAECTCGDDCCCRLDCPSRN